MKTTWEFPIIQKYYYILNFRNVFKPRLLPFYFLNEVAAKRGLNTNVEKKERKFYKIIKGTKLKNQDFDYLLKEGSFGRFTKYNYPKEAITANQKRNYRILMRRRLRRMGLYTKVKNKKKYNSTPDIIQIIPNRQKLANTKNSASKAYKLERKGERWLYFLIEKRKPKHSRYLVTCKVVKVDLKNGTLAICKNHIYRTDFIKPLLMWEAQQLCYHLPCYGDLVDYLTKKGLLF